MADTQDATSAPQDSATETEDAEAQDALAEAAEADDESDQPLGEAGQKAFESNKERLRELKGQLREFKNLGLSPEQIAELKAAQDKASEGEAPDPEQIRAQARQEAQAEALKERALDKIETKAARTLANPEDARLFLSSRVDEFIEDGKIDTEAISEALEELTTERPYLAAQGGKRFQGSADGGARTGSQQPSQLTRDDLKAMTPEQVVAAKQAGQLTNLLGATQ